jgi:50S ribosomal subunit-associated GTPase HflX
MSDANWDDMPLREKIERLRHELSALIERRSVEAERRNQNLADMVDRIGRLEIAVQRLQSQAPSQPPE